MTEPRPKSVSIRATIDADLAAKLDAYLAETPDYSRNSTLIAALKLFLAVEDLEEDDWNAVHKIVFPMRSTPPPAEEDNVAE